MEVAALTDTPAEPDFPSLVATMLAVPVATAVTTPLPLTVATAGSELDHVTVRPVSKFPFASLSVVLAWVLWPIVRLPTATDTVTDATGDAVVVTVSEVCALTPSLVAAMLVVPVANVVARPVEAMVATAVFELLQVTARPVNTFPAASRIVDRYCTVAP